MKLLLCLALALCLGSIHADEHKHTPECSHVHSHSGHVHRPTVNMPLLHTHEHDDCAEFRKRFDSLQFSVNRLSDEMFIQHLICGLGLVLNSVIFIILITSLKGKKETRKGVK